MTSSPLAPRILKGALVSVSATSLIPSVIVFQYNPDTLTRSIKPRAPGGDGARSEAMRLTGPPEETIKVDIEIDAVDQLERSDGIATSLGIYPQLSALEMLTYPSSATVIANTVLLAAGTIEIVPADAPLTLFIWGAKRILPVRISDFSITEEAHDQALNPIRAKVGLGLRVLGYNDLSITNPGYYVFMAHQVVKETLSIVGTISDLTAVAGGNVRIL
ncbi:conserved hypothetical protein; putative signal peptide [Bradyrhizobium sp. ORS 278]|uniref:hypothetical protein n=1 Tax=Bradyrhizobium sp. (strain ORS 278) TaxID=114615 RepID=UPI0001508259|nr:hypothetical protein [Bradyrhizobium sp. ORS 278]CAL78127.1 conserved hypothetical protein; putative signal peptide [Bradyrhizobium sp. ORS 278]